MISEHYFQYFMHQVQNTSAMRIFFLLHFCRKMDRAEIIRNLLKRGECFVTLLYFHVTI